MLPPELQQLTTNFSEHYESYKRPDYNETALRRDFLDKFIKILGWDVDNEANLHEAFREVIHEDRLKINEQSKAPDYCIQQGSAKAFYIEAKKPSVNLRDDTSPALQVRRYGWTAGMPVCLLSDFDEFVVYDTSVKPKNTDSAAVARIFYCNYKDLDVHNPKNAGTETNWEYLYKLFSKEAVWKGSLLKLKTSNKKKGTQEVDEVFLQEIEAWREALAANITNRNATITERELNYVIQKTIDRIIFLRICEDRGIEEESLLRTAAGGKDIYRHLLNLFMDADGRYNSGLFHFHTEKATDDEPDTLSEKITIDDKVLKDIIKNLYYPDGPYEFAVLPADILGSIYERFLGKVIRLTPGHRAKVEDKPEVKKAGGVYYTPQYIVSYIVENTLGPQLAGKTPATLKNFRIVDPACGSGSFLIVAYQYLLDWYLGQYTQKPDQYKKQLTKIGSGGTGGPVSPADYKLTIAERKRILTSHIYGVDIDSQAVEVARLSLLLKALEGLNSQEIQKGLFNERVLPNLSGNVKCGNSLIGNDFYAQGTLGLTEDEQYKINAFDWENEYPEVFKDGGFDVVVGNPPYVKELGNHEVFKNIMNSSYKQYHQGKMDLWYYFLHRAMDIVKQDGLIGFITNSYWIKSSGASKLIARIKDTLAFVNVVYFDDLKIFEGVSGKHMIHIYQKTQQDLPCTYITVDKNNFKVDITNHPTTLLENTDIKSYENKISFRTDTSIFGNCDCILDDFFDVSQGVVEATDKITPKALTKVKNDGKLSAGDGVFVLSEKEINELNLTDEELTIVKKYLDTSDVKRYSINFNNQYLLYTDKQAISKIVSKQYPGIKAHLDIVRGFITSSNKPYGIHRPRKDFYFEGPKLLCGGMFDKPSFSYDDNKHYVGMSFSVIIKRNGTIYSLKYLLGLMNSKLASYWFNTNGKKRGVGVDIGVAVFRQFPIPALDLSKPADKAVHDNIVSLVEQMLVLKKREQAETVPQTKTMIGRQIAALDTQIDKAVYKLYGLTEEEIKVVEGER
ncbi:adenine methyltransferase [Spirochaetia bacterium]|nr:adenine methyltransferase [Spirochaetia bacterium]